MISVIKQLYTFIHFFRLTDCVKVFFFISLPCGIGNFTEFEVYAYPETPNLPSTEFRLNAKKARTS